MTQKPKKLTTEQAASQYRGIDEWSNEQVLQAIRAAQENSVKAIRNVIPAMAKAAGEAALRLKDQNKQGRIVYIGAGTPARLAMQDSTELTPTFGWSAKRLAVVMAGNEQAMLRAIEGAEDDTKAAEDSIAALNLTPADVCIAISASGSTPYTVTACRAARATGALTIGISSNQGADLLQAAEYPVFTDSGAEPVAGSTRMNAGTAQTVALKMISTLIMIRLGHVYDGYMVDVEQTNAKLRLRAAQMVQDITGCSPKEAETALADANGSVKLASLITAGGLNAEEGRALLAKSDNNLRTALRMLKL